MVKTAKAITVTVQEMVGASKPVTTESGACHPGRQTTFLVCLSKHRAPPPPANPDDLGILADQLTNNYGQLAQKAKPSALTAKNKKIGSHIKLWVQELGHVCSALVTKARALQCSPSNAYTKKELIAHARFLRRCLVLAALQAGNRGTQACIAAASAVSGIIADLDTAIMFDTAGTLNQENSETFADHR
ncbi:TLN1 protein, partial [Aegotheles bennettii]|nr:TLN1 protein [Aegotheles bennettii]